MKIASLAGKIQFYNEDVSFVLPYKSKVRTWIAEIIYENGHKIKELNYIFVSDDYLLALNKEMLNHDYYTDIITIPYHDEGAQALHSDIYISLERVLDNAQTLGVSASDELHRVMIHGVLHLLGHKDETEEDKQKMREAENKALERIVF
ncbi:MAG: rRNA maturation RNase YbeY [Bacteroidia bacterium]|nr:rRNA maturation RNase YbeY [Bacteroidia bacterium]